MYNPKSLKAEEFICHEEVLDTLAYAEANKHNAALIDEIIAKAKLRKGLSHREASVLLVCDLPYKNSEYSPYPTASRQLHQDCVGQKHRTAPCRVHVQTVYSRRHWCVKRPKFAKFRNG